MNECRPDHPYDQGNDFHELWWDSVAGGEARKGKLTTPLHEVWQYMGDAPEPFWQRCGFAEEFTPRQVYEEGWRWVRQVALLDYFRMDGDPPLPPAQY